MTVTELLADLHQKGIDLWIEGSQLCYSAPKGVLTPALLATLTAQKAEVIEALQKSQVARPGASPLSPPDRPEHLPLSIAQQELWFLHHLIPDANYNVLGIIQLTGSLRVDLLEQSLNEIVRRHEILRTTFASQEGHPVQIIVHTLLLSLPILDLSRLPVSLQRSEMLRVISLYAHQPFALDHSPLVRGALFCLSTQEHALLLCIEHMVFDGWSMDVLVQELITHYEAFIHGKPAQLAALPLQYADYALWQQQWVKEEHFANLLAYWQKQLAGIPPVLELPADRTRPMHRTFQVAHYTSNLSKELTAGLKDLSRHEGVSLFMTLLATFKTLLYRYTGQVDLVVGTPIANRTHADFEGLLGCFVNTIALRTNLSGNPTFRELLQRIRHTTIAAFAHQEVPYERLVAALVPNRHPGFAPLAQVKFVLQNPSIPTYHVAGLTLRPVEIEDESYQFDLNISMSEDLMLVMVESDGALMALINYNTDIFTQEIIRRMMDHLAMLLEQVIIHPDQPVSLLSYLTGHELQQLLSQWNSRPTPYLADRCIHHLFEAQVERAPDAIAAIFEASQLSYQDLNRHANQLARYLRTVGIGPGVLVGVSFERSCEMVLAILAILKAGGAFVPLDPTYPEERLTFLIQDTHVPVILTQQRLRFKFAQHAVDIQCLDAIWQSIACEEQHNLPASETGVSAQSLAYLIYTSGSTGKPKGALLCHRGVCNMSQAQAATFGVKPGDRILQFATLNFDASIFEIFMALLQGATLSLARQESLLPGPAFNNLLDEQAITNLTIPPSLLDVLSPTRLAALQTLIVAGEACPTALAARWSQGRRFFNAYGLTETTIWATVAKYNDGEQKLTIGRPIANTEVYLLDPHLQLTPVGVPGELHIGGVGLAYGYLNRPDLTAERFVPDLFSTEPGARLYKTGDLACYQADGSIEYLGRIDRQVKLHGFRIEPGEIEAGVNRYPGVKQSVVAIRENASGERSLVAYVVPTSAPEAIQHASKSVPATLDIALLRNHLKGMFPTHLVPSVFVTIDALPLTLSGKVDMKALSKLENSPPLSTAGLPPRSELEQSIAHIWQEVLEIEQVGVYDNFFDLGGHSLLLGQVHDRLQAVLHKDISVLDLFTYPTIHALAEHISQDHNEDDTFQPDYDRGASRRAAATRQQQIRQKSSVVTSDPGVHDEE